MNPNIQNQTGGDKQKSWRVMEYNEITVFHRSIEACADPAEIARKVKLAFKRMPGEMALACFAKVMTAELPHQIKVAVWDAVRYSHIWWGVDAVLQGAVMENPIVQQAFADAVPMRKWMVANKRDGWDNLCMTLGDASSYRPDLRNAKKMAQGNRVPLLIHLITHFFDFSAAIMIREQISDVDSVREIVGYRDGNGNNLLWYLTYRDDQNASGGFACHCIEDELLRLGVDPNHYNNLGLCWNDVRHHLNGSEET